MGGHTILSKELLKGLLETHKTVTDSEEDVGQDKEHRGSILITIQDADDGTEMDLKVDGEFSIHELMTIKEAFCGEINQLIVETMKGRYEKLVNDSSS